MKKYALLVVLLAIGFGSWAQKKMNREEDRHASRLRSELSLSDDQVKSLKIINDQFREEHARLRSDTAVSAAKARSERTRLLNEREERIEKILSKEQIAKWNALKSRGGDPSEEHERHRNPQGDMRAALGLSEEQAKQMMAANRAMSDAFRALRSDSSVTRENRGEAMKGIMEKRDAAVKKFLSDEQYQKFLAYEEDKTRHNRRMGAGKRSGPRK